MVIKVEMKIVVMIACYLQDSGSFCMFRRNNMPAWKVVGLATNDVPQLLVYLYQIDRL
jgi:hypothetical protein